MKEYKRLTRRDNGIGIISLCKACKRYGTELCTAEESEGICCLTEQQERLAELEDKIENGTLWFIPCKVNDVVYVLREDSFAEDNYKTMWHIAEGFVKKIYINKKNEIFLQIISWLNHKSWSKDSRNYKLTTFDKAVFLTREEAEAKLKELKEKENDNSI